MAVSCNFQVENNFRVYYVLFILIIIRLCGLLSESGDNGKNERVKAESSTVTITDHTARVKQRTVFISDVPETKGLRLLFIPCSAL